MKNRTTEFRRDMRSRKIKHRKRICLTRDGYDWYKHDGQYDKGKIHCSCKLCTYSKWYGLPTLTDMKELERLKDALKDYYEL